MPAAYLAQFLSLLGLELSLARYLPLQGLLNQLCFLQLTLGLVDENRYHTNINKGVILMCAKPVDDESTPEYQEFVLEPQDFAYWSDQWMRRVELYYLIK